MTVFDDGTSLPILDPDASVIVPTWEPADLKAVLAAIARGQPVGPVPTLLERTDGVRLMYPGAVHQFAAEPESGKTWVLLGESARIVRSGGLVVFLDFEDSVGPVIERMLALGVPEDELIAGFVYLRPEGYPQPEIIETLCRLSPTLVVVDGISAAYSMLGLDLDRNQDVEPFMAVMSRPFQNAGAAVAFIDHVTKNRETRNGHALGAGQKKARVAVGFEIEVVTQPARGKAGLLKLKVTKDKYGHLGEHDTGGKHRVIAMVHIDSTESGSVAVRIEPPDAAGGSGATWRPTGYMEKVSRHLETFPDSTKNNVETSGLGGAKHVRAALETLVTEGFVSIAPGPRNSKICTSLKPFREDDDRVGLDAEAEGML